MHIAPDQYVIRIAAETDGEPLPLSHCIFLRDYFPHADDHDALKIGGGVATFTPHIEQAKRFATLDEAREFRCQQHPSRPIRADGMPNRPLTALTVDYRQVSEFRRISVGVWQCEDKSDPRFPAPPGVPGYMMGQPITWNEIRVPLSRAPETHIMLFFDEKYSVQYDNLQMITRVSVLSNIFDKFFAGEVGYIDIPDGRRFAIPDIDQMYVVPAD